MRKINTIVPVVFSKIELEVVTSLQWLNEYFWQVTVSIYVIVRHLLVNIQLLMRFKTMFMLKVLS